jgi:glycosyltransferase involved in cell wall biosynthesis
MVTVAFVHNRFPAGGAERITIDIARYLKDVGGYRVYVYTTRVNQMLMTEELDEILTIRHIPSQAIQTRRSAAVEKLLESDGVDILVQVGKALKGIDGIRRRTGCKSVVACHGEPFWQRYVITHRRKKGLIRRTMWMLFNKRRYEKGNLAMRTAVQRTMVDYLNSDAYIVLCEPYIKQVTDVLGYDPATSHIYAIENSDLPVQDICWKKDNIIMFCGRFENWSKRIDRLLRIWGKVQDKLPQWSLQLVGDGPDAPMLRKMAEELGLERISFEGMQKDVGRYYDKASVVAMTSETEGWGLALSEAQARGCIGIAFECTSGVAEILQPDGECGFLVPPFDEEAYAETLLRIASMTEEEQMRIRRNAVNKRLQYTPELIAEKWRLLFDRLVSR